MYFLLRLLLYIISSLCYSNSVNVGSGVGRTEEITESTIWCNTYRLHECEPCTGTTEVHHRPRFRREPKSCTPSNVSARPGRC
uniref:Putative secreted peptide n=1 Tax=Anopheles braziliensis TaxID=58242 RepID=A0A2M3ZW44_9DIPT